MDATTNDLCPSCGKWEFLLEETGFCLQCSREQYPRLCLCSVCSHTFDSKDRQQRVVCPSCAKERWLERNADKIESYMRIGLTFSMAVAKVIFDNRPSCLSCGKKIKGGQRGQHFFCNTTFECRKAARRYVYFWQTKGLDKEAALKEVLKTLGRRIAA